MSRNSEQSFARQHDHAAFDRPTDSGSAPTFGAGLVALLAAALALGGCKRSDSGDAPDIAAELRALRMAMREAPAESQGATPARAALPAEQVRTALEPLRAALAELGESQRALNERQGQLAGEMQRWTQLVSSARQPPTTASEVSALAERLAAIESTTAAQEERHRHVEQMLAGALDRTADQLQQFLARVGALQGLPAAAAPAPGESGSSAGNDPPQAANSMPESIGSDAGASAPRPPEIPTGEEEAHPEALPAAAPAGRPTEIPDGNTGGASPRVAERSHLPAESEGAPAGDRDGSLTLASGLAAPTRAKLEWVWWVLPFAAVLAGIIVLWRQRQPVGVALAPEMDAPSINELEHLGVGPAVIDLERHVAETRHREVATTPIVESLPMDGPAKTEQPSVAGDRAAMAALATQPRSPEDQPPPATKGEAGDVDEIWAAAELLGEAIGRLRQDGGSLPRDAAAGETLAAEEPEGESDDASTGALERGPDAGTVEADAAAELFDTAPLHDEHWPMEDDSAPPQAAMRAESDVPDQQQSEHHRLDEEDEFGDLFVIEDGEFLGDEPDLDETPPAEAPLDRLRDELSGPLPDFVLPTSSAAEPVLEQGSGFPDSTFERDSSFAGDLGFARDPGFATNSARNPEPTKDGVRTDALLPRAAASVPPPTTNGPERVNWRIAAADEDAAVERLRAALARDPRVLLQPAPVFRSTQGQVEISCALLPDLPAGERSVLEQQLRDALV